jgi:chemotaxis protein MotB
MFIVLYAFANTDLKKFEALAKSLAEGFGATAPAMGATDSKAAGTEQGSSPVFDTSGGGTSPIQLFPENQSPIKIMDFAEQLTGTEQGGLREQLQQAVAAANKGAGANLGKLQGQVEISYNERGIVISIYPNQILFASGSAQLKPGFKQILNVLGPQLKRLPNSIEVDGHTDSIPISTASFPSNWELSAARAGAVIRYFEALGLDRAKLSAAGYADTRPVDVNATADGRARNRRVEIIVLRGAQEKLPELPAERLGSSASPTEPPACSSEQPPAAAPPAAASTAAPQPQPRGQPGGQ